MVPCSGSAARERIVGWYHTAHGLTGNDIKINEVIKRFVAHPVLVVVDTQLQSSGLPTRAYVAVNQIHNDGTPATQTFEHVASEIGAEEAEEVGVEHLLRDIKDVGEAGSLSNHIQRLFASLMHLQGHLITIANYVNAVANGKLPVNHDISYLLQEIFNLLPNLDLQEFVQSISTKTSDDMLVIYLASLIRATIALHSLISNKVSYSWYILVIGLSCVDLKHTYTCTNCLGGAASNRT